MLEHTLSYGIYALLSFNIFLVLTVSHTAKIVGLIFAGIDGVIIIVLIAVAYTFAKKKGLL